MRDGMTGISLDTHDRSDHLVFMYGRDSAALASGVGEYLAEGLGSGQAAIVIATRAHRDAFIEQLTVMHADPHAAIEQGRLVILDACDRQRLHAAARSVARRRARVR
jgi:hypothetical protein